MGTVIGTAAADMRVATVPPQASTRFSVAVPERVAALVDRLREIPDFTEPEGDTFVVTAGPNEILKDGVVIGYEVWVKHFDAEGYEIDIDPHRQFLYPPDGSYLDEQGVKQLDETPEVALRGMLSRTIRDTPGRS